MQGRTLNRLLVAATAVVVLAVCLLALIATIELSSIASAAGRQETKSNGLPASAEVAIALTRARAALAMATMAIAGGLMGGALYLSSRLRSPSTAVSHRIPIHCGQLIAGSKEARLLSDTLGSSCNHQAETLDAALQSVEEIARASVDLGSQLQQAHEALRIGQNHLEAVVTAEGALNQQVIEMADRFAVIGEGARKVEDIAFQANILAINAAIEAGRAGDAGQGFSALAEEMRLLSEKTSAVAKAIADEASSETSKHEGVNAANSPREITSQITSIQATLQRANAIISTQRELSINALNAIAAGRNAVQRIIGHADQYAAQAETLERQATALMDLPTSTSGSQNSAANTPGDGGIAMGAPNRGTQKTADR